MEPGEEQWSSEWTEEEEVLFLDTVKQNGCGDKWGLFASYIPHRVGYQCSAFYRTLLARGLIFDPHYRMNDNGVAVYVGQQNKDD